MKGVDGTVKVAIVLELIVGGKLLLVQLQRHANTRCDDFVEKVHVEEDPLVALAMNAHVTLEQRMKAIEKVLDAKGAGGGGVRSIAQRPSGEQAQAKAQVDQKLFVLLQPHIVDGIEARLLDAIDNPLAIDGAETGACNTRAHYVVVLVDVEIECWIEINERLVVQVSERVGQLATIEPAGAKTFARDAVVDDRLDIIRDERLAQIVGRQNSGGRILRDRIALQHVIGLGNLPRQPPLVEGGIQREHSTQMPRLATTTALIVADAFGDRLDLALLTISAAKFQATHLKRDQSIAQLDNVHQTVEVVAGEHKAIALVDHTPTAEHNVAVE